MNLKRNRNIEMNPRGISLRKLSPEEMFLVIVIRSFWVPAWRIVQKLKRTKKITRLKAADVLELIESLRSVRDLGENFVFYCELAGIDPVKVRNKVSEKTGMSLDDMIEQLKKLHGELCEKEMKRGVQ